MFEQIKKRNGRIVEFDSSKITVAIAEAGKATGTFEDREARKLTLRVLTLAHELRRRGGGYGAAALCGGGGQGDALILRVA